MKYLGLWSPFYENFFENFVKPSSPSSYKQKRIPIVYWIPKMQKNPTDARFIIASKYALQNKSLNLFSMPSSSYTPCTSFSTLNTKLPHYQLKSNFHSFFILFLKVGTKLFIRLSSGTAYWGKKNKRRIWFIKTSIKASLKTAVHNLIKNCYYNVANVTKKQAIGVPMETILTQHHFGQTFFYILMKKNPCHFQDIQDTSKTFPLNKALH